MTEELETRCEPHAFFQVMSCTGTEHAMHRKNTGMALYFCNCGYTSGWVDADTLPPSDEFIDQHRPPGVRSRSWTGMPR